MIGDVPIAAPGRDPEAVTRELARRAERFGAVPDAVDETGVAMLAWTIGDTRFALPIGAVWAVLPPMRTTTVPGAGAPLIGIFGRMGVVHNLFDPGPALGLASGTGHGGVIIILRQKRPRIAIRVDAAIGIIEVPAGDGAIETEDGPVTRLDMDELVGRLIGRAGAKEG